MIYLVGMLPLLGFLSACLISSLSLFHLSFAALAIGASVAAVVTKKAFLASISLLLSVLLYLSSSLPADGPVRVIATSLYAGALFVHGEVVYDLIAIRIRKFPLKAYRHRFRSIAQTVVAGSAIVIGVLVVGASTLHHLSFVVNSELMLPGLAVLIGGCSLSVVSRSRNAFSGEASPEVASEDEVASMDLEDSDR